MRDHLIAALFEQCADLLVGHRRRDHRRAWRSRRGFQSLAGFGLLDIPRNDAAMRARAVDTRKLDAGVFCQTSRQWRGENSAVTVGPWRTLRRCTCGGLGRGSRRTPPWLWPRRRRRPPFLGGRRGCRRGWGGGERRPGGGGGGPPPPPPSHP